MSKRLYIETVGCQMNVLDSELVVAGLVEAGYELVDSPRKADAILFNTCSVRQHAEDKIYSALGRLKPLKERRPEMIIGVLGCMAQKDQALVFRRASHVDLVVGPGQLSRLPTLLEEVATDRRARGLCPWTGTTATGLPLPASLSPRVVSQGSPQVAPSVANRRPLLSGRNKRLA